MPPTPYFQSVLAFFGKKSIGKTARATKAKRRHEHSRAHTRIASDLIAEAGLRRLRRSLAMVAVVVIYGTLGYWSIEHLSFLDALYQTVITIFGVGFGEVKPFSAAGRIFTISLIVGGTGVALYALGTGFELLVSEQFGHWRQRRRMQNNIDRLHNHFIVCGYGRIGQQLVEDFREAGVGFVVVDASPQRCVNLLEQGVPHIEGDATLDETLLEAGIERAKGLVGALNSDADNVMTVVTARGLNPKLFIVARAAVPEAEKKLARAGADEVISPYVVGARRISLSLLRPAVSNFLNAVIYDRELQAEMTEIVLEADSPLCGQTLAEAGLAHGRDVLPLAMMRDGRLIFSPLPDTLLQVGDALIIVTPIASLNLAR
jgi:voltage-gated potassium channel